MSYSSFSSITRFIDSPPLGFGIVKNPNFIFPDVSHNTFTRFDVTGMIPKWSYGTENFVSGIIADASGGNGLGFYNMTSSQTVGFEQYIILNTNAGLATPRIYPYVAQKIPLNVGQYTLEFYATGRPHSGFQYGPTPLMITLDGVTIAEYIRQTDSILYWSDPNGPNTIGITEWKKQQIPFSVSSVGWKELRFTGDISGATGITGVNVIQGPDIFNA